MRFVWRGLLIVCLAVGASTPYAAASESLEQFKHDQRELMQLLRSKQTPDRVEAVKRLQQLPIEDSVRLIHGVLNDAEPDVRRAAYDALLAMNGNYEVCEALLRLAKKGIHGRDQDGAIAAITILLSSKLRSTQRAVEELLNNVALSPNGVVPMVALIDALAARRDGRDVAALAQLTKTQLFENHLGVRRAVVQALTRIPSKHSIGLLIEIMDRPGGEARADAVEHLTQVTDQALGMDVAAWRAWWSTAKETYTFPDVTVEEHYRETLTESAAGYYYGIPLLAERLVFVLDTSSSMEGPRIAAAKRELVQAISGLPPSVHFGLITFNTRIEVWQRKLVPATDQFKRAAINYIGLKLTNSSTASFDALDAAMAFDTEAIYFLSDGAPTAGKIVAPVDIVTAVQATNKLRRISFYTIGVGAGTIGSPVDVFLRTLAEKNLGCYRRVDN